MGTRRKVCARAKSPLGRGVADCEVILDQRKIAGQSVGIARPPFGARPRGASPAARDLFDVMIDELRHDALHDPHRRLALGLLLLDGIFGDDHLFETRRIRRRDLLSLPEYLPRTLPRTGSALTGEDHSGVGLSEQLIRELIKLGRAEGDVEQLLLEAALRERGTSLTIEIPRESWLAAITEMAEQAIKHHDRVWHAVRGGALATSRATGSAEARGAKSARDALHTAAVELGGGAGFWAALALKARDVRCRLIGLANKAVFRAVGPQLALAERRAFVFLHLQRGPIGRLDRGITHWFEGPFSDSPFFTNLWACLPRRAQDTILEAVCFGDVSEETLWLVRGLLRFAGDAPKRVRELEAEKKRSSRLDLAGVTPGATKVTRPSFTQALVAATADILRPKEKRVAELEACGMSVRAMAAELGVSHQNIYKLRASALDRIQRIAQTDRAFGARVRSALKPK